VRRTRHVRRPPDLTSLFDVLFIVVFAALIRAAAVENAAARPPTPAAAPPRAPGPPPEIAALRQRALADFASELANRPPLVVRISAHGTVESIEADGKRVAAATPLLEPSADPEFGVSYLGDRAADLRICRMAALYLGTAQLARYFVIMAPAVPLVDLPHAVRHGLDRDLIRCLTEQHTIATLVDPADLPAPPPQGPR